MPLADGKMPGITITTIDMKRFLLAITLVVSMTKVHAQVSVTYNHDSPKQSQFTVMEVGTGALTPDAYYWALHNKYRKNAAVKNKLGYRTTAGIGLYNQKDEAEKIDSSLTQRAKIEALNVADRQVDLAWQVEGNKITSAMENFGININRIVAVGGTPNERERWDGLFDMYNCAIRATREAYMPNAQRKKEYLKIYAEVESQNDLLIKYLVQLHNRSQTTEILEAENPVRVNKAAIAASAMSRWKSSSQKGGSGNGGNSNGNDNEEVIIK